MSDKLKLSAEGFTTLAEYYKDVAYADWPWGMVFESKESYDKYHAELAQLRREASLYVDMCQVAEDQAERIERLKKALGAMIPWADPLTIEAQEALDKAIAALNEG